MPAAAEGIVRSPADDQPALADPITETLLNIHVRRTRRHLAAGVYWPIGLAAAGLLLSPVMHAGPGLVVVLCVLSICVVVVARGAIVNYVQLGRWARRAGPMLRAEAWRQVPALVTERGVIEVHEDVDTVWQLRTPPLGAAIPELITRTRRVWLVGPDAKGWLSFRVDGSRSPLPARRTRVSVASVAREPASPGTTGTAADDPVAALMARDLRRTLLRVLWGPVLALPIIAALVAGLSMMTRSATGWFVLGVLLVALLVPGETNRWRAGHDIRAVPALLAAGPWQRIAIQLDGWNAPQNSTLATANGTVQLGDGTSLELTITASVSLLGNIDETGTAWIAGEPAPGRKRAVGIPGYPLLGVVAFS